MKEKIICVSDEKIFDYFINSEMSYLGSFNKDGITIHQFENNEILKYSDVDMNKIKFTNKLCF